MSHIKNFYEDSSIDLQSISSLIQDVCLCKLKNVTEKLDGQNFTFTVKAGPRVKFLGKGMPKSIVDVGGLDRDGIFERFGSTPTIRDTFVVVYDVLQRLVEGMPEQFVHNEFRNGTVAWSAEVLCPETRNVISYQQRSIRLIASNGQNQTNFPKVCEQATKDDEWIVGSVPNLKQLRRLDALERAKKFTTDWHLLAFKANGSTMGHLRTALVAEQLRGETTWSTSIIEGAAARLALGDKTKISKKSFVSEHDWKQFQNIESTSVFVNEALSPLEEFFRRLGVYALETVNPVLAESSQKELDATINMVKNVQRAIEKGRVSADQRIMERIRSADRRCPRWNELGQLHTKNIEGIVFEWQGKMRKLTGYYTPINRLLGFFRFGQNPATII